MPRCPARPLTLASAPRTNELRFRAGSVPTRETPRRGGGRCQKRALRRAARSPSPLPRLKPADRPRWLVFFVTICDPALPSVNPRKFGGAAARSLAKCRLSATRFCEDRLSQTSLYRLLHEKGARLFPDDSFLDLFREPMPT
jgi:hypothetical protein